MSGPADSEQEVHRVWDDYWRNASERKPWDIISRTVFLALKRQAGGFAGKSVLEVGCGTGRISREVLRQGGQVALLDISAEALELAQEQFLRAGCDRCDVAFIRGTLFALPLAQSSFDIVWNAGVLEHFTDEEQYHAIQELVRVTKPGGKVIVLVPYRYSPLYRLGKFVMEETGRWPYGVERPVGSYRNVADQLNLSLSEHCTSFLPLMEQILANLPGIGKKLQAKFSVHYLEMDEGAFQRADRRWSTVGRGHLLCCTFQR